MDKFEKHSVRFLGGAGSIFLVYFILRTFEKTSLFSFLIVFALMAYTTGWLMDRRG